MNVVDDSELTDEDREQIQNIDELDDFLRERVENDVEAVTILGSAIGSYYLTHQHQCTDRECGVLDEMKKMVEFTLKLMNDNPKKDMRH